MNNLNVNSLSVPLGQEAHNLARQFVTETMSLIPTSLRQKIGKQIYLNTLAVYAVNTYLKWQAYSVDIQQGDLGNPLLRSRLNIADLMINGIGQLECRPLVPHQETLLISNEATENRIGYLIVELNEELKQGKLLGFTPDIQDNNYLQIGDLQSLDNFIDHLERLEKANDFFLQNDPVIIKVKEKLTDINLRDLVRELEKIYRLESDDEKPFAIKDILSGKAMMIGLEKESDDFDNDDFELMDLAEELLEKLQSIWE